MDTCLILKEPGLVHRLHEEERMDVLVAGIEFGR